MMDKVILTCLIFTVVVVVTGQETAKKKCYQCDNKGDLNDPCFQKQTNQTLTCEADEKCFTKIEGNKITRACVTGTTKCDSPGCYSCDKDWCNDNKQLLCYQCSGDDCLTVADSTKNDNLKPCPTATEGTKTDQCVRFIDDNKVTRGCLLDQNEKCGKIDCNKCDQDKCNNEPAITCLKCDDCPHPEKTTGDSCSLDIKTTCSTFDKTCYTYIDKNFHRDCIKPDKIDAANIKSCEGTGCNKDCFFDSCAQCNSKDDPKCLADKEMPTQKCSFATSCHTCQTLASDIIYRGCGDEKTNATVSCQNCFGEKCNTEKLSKKTCFFCDSTKENECNVWNDKMEKKFCTNDTDDCVTLLDDTTKKTIRNCYSEVKEIEKLCKGESCIKCSTSNCNSAFCDISGCASMSHCVRCRSDLTEDCAKKAETISTTDCANKDTFERHGCYTDVYNGIVFRGCVVDLETFDFYECNKTDSKTCTVCKDPGCNVKPRNSAMAINAGWLSFAVGMMVFLKKMFAL